MASDQGHRGAAEVSEVDTSSSSSSPRRRGSSSLCAGKGVVLEDGGAGGSGGEHEAATEASTIAPEDVLTPSTVDSPVELTPEPSAAAAAAPEGGEGQDEAEGQSEVGGGSQGPTQDSDHLIHWWCERQMARCLRKLMRSPEAVLFLEPLPWEELGLEDWPEVVQDPIDLKTIGETLESGGYEDDEGLINPEWFWEDVALCWENFLVYCEEDQESEAYKTALRMSTMAEELEDTFWDDLDEFEQGLDSVDPALTSLAASANVATHAMEEAATVTWEKGGEIVEDLRGMLMDLLGWGYTEAEPPPQHVPQPQAPEPQQLKRSQTLLVENQRRVELRVFFENLAEIAFLDIDLDVAFKDLEEIEEDLNGELPVDWPFSNFQLQDEAEADDEAQAIDFEGHDQKVPAEKLLPKDWSRSRCPSSRGSLAIAGALEDGVASLSASRRASRAGSRIASRAASRRGSRRPSVERRSSRGHGGTGPRPARHASGMLAPGPGDASAAGRHGRDHAARLLKAPHGPRPVRSASGNISGADSDDGDGFEAQKVSLSALKVMLHPRRKKDKAALEPGGDQAVQQEQSEQPDDQSQPTLVSMPPATVLSMQLPTQDLNRDDDSDMLVN